MSDNSNIQPKTLQQLEKLAQQINIIKKPLRLGTASLTPLNYQEEMEKFFNSKTHNPQYIYKKREYPNFIKIIDKYKLEFDKLLIPDDLQEHIQDFLDDLKILYDTKKSIGTKRFSSAAHKLFDWGSDRLDLLLTNTPAVEFTMFIKHNLQDANSIKKRFEGTLGKYQIDSFDVNLNEFSPHIINVGYKNISVGSQIKRFECNVDRLVVHEIESHVLQMENTKRAKTALSEFTKYGNQHLYGEGLAIYNEIITRKITPSAFELYYSRIKAVRQLNKSFREIFDVLSETLTPQRAYVMTYRVKRGMNDTSQPGGFPKDASYLLGFHEVENLIAEKYPKKLLYATKSPVLSTLLSKYNLINTNTVITPRFS